MRKCKSVSYVNTIQFSEKYWLNDSCEMSCGATNIYVTLDNKTSLEFLGYICSNSQKYTVWVKIIKKNIYFIKKIIRILSKDHVP